MLGKPVDEIKNVAVEKFFFASFVVQKFEYHIFTVVVRESGVGNWRTFDVPTQVINVFFCTFVRFGAMNMPVLFVLSIKYFVKFKWWYVRGKYQSTFFVFFARLS